MKTNTALKKLDKLRKENPDMEVVFVSPDGEEHSYAKLIGISSVKITTMFHDGYYPYLSKKEILQEFDEYWKALCGGSEDLGYKPKKDFVAKCFKEKVKKVILVVMEEA